MRRKVLGLALAVLAVSAAASAQSIAEGKWWKRPRIAQELALTADQAARLEKIFAASKPKLIDLRADLEKKEFDYDQTMQADAVDRKTVEAKIEARELARAALQKELALMELDMKAVLNVEQREKLVRMRDNARTAMQKRRRQMRDGVGAADLDDTPIPAPRRRTPP